MLRKRVFILTPSSGFGDLIRQVLEDTGAYQPFLFSKAEEAIEPARKEAVALIVLDAELGVQTHPELLGAVRDHAPHARLVIIPAEDDPDDPRLKSLGADAILPSPFYLPDLLAAIEQFFGPIVPQDAPKRSSYGDKATLVQTPARQESSAPVWLEDVAQAAAYLTQLSLESASRAALITKGDEAWAYAGELPKQAADELAAAVAEHTANSNKADLARFIHLQATGVDYMLYATELGGGFTLALAFDAQMPFSQMRAQVNHLAKALVSAPQAPRNETRAISEPTQQPLEIRSQAGDQDQPPSTSRGGGAEKSGKPVPSTSIPAPVRLDAPEAIGPDLSYSYVLIPRLPRHRLEGDLARNLGEWLPDLCLAFAWRLEGISVETDFLLWTLSVSPGTSPQSAAQLIDEYLSGYVFEAFPRLARENPSGKFWAPGVLISAARPSAQRIEEYVSQTRAHQGAPR